MTDRRTEIEAALDHFIQSFATDGYRLEVVSFRDGALDLAIESEPHACADCLVPPDMMIGLVRTQLGDQPDVTNIRIKYPGNHD